MRATDGAEVAQRRQLAAHLLDVVGQIAGRDHLGRAAMIEQRAQLERPQQHVDRHRHRADAHRAEKHRRQLGRVVHQKRDAIAGLHAELAQRARRSHHLVRQASVGPDSLRLANRRLIPPPRF